MAATGEELVTEDLLSPDDEESVAESDGIVCYAPPKQPYEDVEAKEAKARTAPPLTNEQALQWLKDRGFMGVRQMITFEEEHYMNTEEFNPMSYAAETGELAMMKWLYANGAKEDVSRVNDDGNFPMGHACYGGHLECCKWLYSLGGLCIEQVHLRNEGGTSPFLMSAMEGRLHVMKWLFYDAGAAADIRGINISGRSPYNCAQRFKHSETCKWLILNGALNDPDDEELHVTHEIVAKDTRPDALDDDSDSDDEESEDAVAARREDQLNESFGKRMIRWAHSVVEQNRLFFNIVVMGMCCRFGSSSSVAGAAASDDDALRAKRQRTSLPAITKLGSLGSDTTRGFLQRIADLLGVQVGRPLRNVQEFATHLEAAMEARRLEVQQQGDTA